MAFARAARFPVRVPGRDFSTPGPGTYSPRASCGLPRVLVYTFGQPSPPKPRPPPKAKAVAIVNDAQPQRTTQLATPRLQQDEALPSVDVAQLALRTWAVVALARSKREFFEAKPLLLSTIGISHTSCQTRRRIAGRCTKRQCS